MEATAVGKKAGRAQKAKPAFFDDWSKASYLNFWFYSSIKGSWQKRSRFGRVQLATLSWEGQPQPLKARPDFHPWCQSGMGFPVSQREGEQTATAPARALPGASSSFKCCLPGASAGVFSSSETLCNVWKGSTLTQLVGVCRGRGALCLPPRLPGSPCVQVWPRSLFPFTLMVDAESLSMLAALSPTALYRPRVLSPWALATPSGFGVPASAPCSDSEAAAGPRAAQKKRELGVSGGF